MNGLMIIIGIFALFAFVIYLPAIYYYICWKYYEKKFQKELAEWKPEPIIITQKLGLGTILDRSISFEEAQKHQNFALNSALCLFKDLEVVDDV